MVSEGIMYKQFFFGYPTMKARGTILQRRVCESRATYYVKWYKKKCEMLETMWGFG